MKLAYETPQKLQQRDIDKNNQVEFNKLCGHLIGTENIENEVNVLLLIVERYEKEIFGSRTTKYCP